MKANLSDGTSRINVRMYDNIKTNKLGGGEVYRYVVLPLNAGAGHSGGPAQASGSG